MQMSVMCDVILEKAFTTVVQIHGSHEATSSYFQWNLIHTERKILSFLLYICTVQYYSESCPCMDVSCILVTLVTCGSSFTCSVQFTHAADHLRKTYTGFYVFTRNMAILASSLTAITSLATPRTSSLTSSPLPPLYTACCGHRWRSSLGWSFSAFTYVTLT